MNRSRLRKSVAATSAAAFAVFGLSLTTAPAALADGMNGEVRGFLWPGGNGIPNWEGTYRMPDGSEAWCASIWAPEPIHADSYGDPVPLTKNDGSALSDQEMTTLAYVVSTASEVVINKTGRTADEYAAAASVIIHDMTNSDPSAYDPAQPLAHFDANEDPLGTGQTTTGVHGVYDALLADAALYGGEWTLEWAPAPLDVHIGDVVTLGGTLTTVSGTPIPNTDVYITAAGATPSSATATTDAAGAFTFDATVTAGSVTLTASRIAPASTVMMREPESWAGNERPQNMVLVDDNEVSDTLAFPADEVVVPAEPSIGTSATDQADGDRIIDWAGGTVIDAVSYQNLTPGTEYTLTGELIDKATGEGTGITGTTSFTPSEPSGTVDVVFTIPEGFDGTTLVAFERLYDIDGQLVATHEDPDDEAQTVTVNPKPVIGTSATDQADGDRIIDWAGGTVIDAVSYQNLTPGTEYTLTGELIDKATGKGTGIKGTTTFTPSTPSGTVDVTFTIPAGFDGKTLVAFERLYDIDGRLVATHEDPDDEAQTVTVAPKPKGGLAVTGSDAPVALTLSGIGLLIAAGALLTMKRAALRR